ncbi:MAG: glycosyltransferase [Bacteroidetes bacterium]|nr:glycosyltransferase [Bacteroidota bacterium]
MKKIKIAIFLISPGKAGVESVLSNILRYFNSEKVELFLVTNSEIATYYKGLIEPEKHLVLGKYFFKITNKYIRFLVTFLKNKLKIEKIKLNLWSKKVCDFLEANNINAVHAHLVWDYYLASIIKEKKPKIKYLNTMHGTLSLDPVDNYFPFFKRNEILKMLSNVDGYSSACIYFINLLKLWKIPVRNFSIISNGIDSNLSSKSKTNNNSEIVKICFMGGGRPHQKGGDILIYSLHLLKTQCKINNFKLLIYGNVSVHSKERELANILELNNYIEWRGFVEPPFHLKGMEESDIFVLPSRHEGVANTLMEAIGMEMPIVATKVGGTPEVINHLENGLLCFPDASDLSEKLANLIKDYNLRCKLSINNKQLKKEYYWEKICLDYEEFYEKFALK